MTTGGGVLTADSPGRKGANPAHLPRRRNP